MSHTLTLTARSEGRNDRHIRIGVFQNGGKAGVLTVEAEQEAAVRAFFNSHDALLEACKALTAYAQAHGGPNDYAALNAAVAAIALAEGGSVDNPAPLG